MCTGIPKSCSGRKQSQIWRKFLVLSLSRVLRSDALCTWILNCTQRRAGALRTRRVLVMRLEQQCYLASAALAGRVAKSTYTTLLLDWRTGIERCSSPQKTLSYPTMIHNLFQRRVLGAQLYAAHLLDNHTLQQAGRRLIATIKSLGLETLSLVLYVRGGSFQSGLEKKRQLLQNNQWSVSWNDS